MPPPTVLRDNQYEILTADETRSLVFGTEDTGYLTLTRPVWSGSDSRLGDTDRSQEDGIQFGRDYRGAKSVAFEMGVLTDATNNLVPVGSTAHRANLDRLNTLEGWWRDSRLRRRPWDYACLRCCEAGTTWRAYGRPRRYDEMAGKFTQVGYTPVMADFQLTDDRVYADVVESVIVGLQQVPEGGLVAPLIAPLTTTPAVTAEGVVTVGGSRDTWLWATFQGPVTNPRVVIGDLTIGLNLTIPDGVTITADPRPWSRGVFRNDGASFAGAVSAATPQMQDLLIWPGEHEANYTGIDATGTSQCTVSWRAARSRP